MSLEATVGYEEDNVNEATVACATRKRRTPES
jgi:hypothetical protein